MAGLNFLNPEYSETFQLVILTNLVNHVNLVHLAILVNQPQRSGLSLQSAKGKYQKCLALLHLSIICKGNWDRAGRNLCNIISSLNRKVLENCRFYILFGHKWILGYATDLLLSRLKVPTQGYRWRVLAGRILIGCNTQLNWLLTTRAIWWWWYAPRLRGVTD